MQQIFSQTGGMRHLVADNHPELQPRPTYQRRVSSKRRRRDNDMLWTIFVILLILWVLGLVSSYTLGGFIHILLLLALVALIIQLVTGRRTAV
jgi:fatty acid desaturase